MYANKVGDYRKNEIITADPKQLVAICYNTAITNFKLAKVKYLEKEYEEKANAIKKALDIVGELKSALDFERGGQIAVKLNALYDYILRRIPLADIKKDLDAFDEVVHILEELSEAWTAAVIRGGKSENQTTPWSDHAQNQTYRSSAVRV